MILDCLFYDLLCANKALTRLAANEDLVQWKTD